MAIGLTITNEQGVSATYWRIKVDAPNYDKKVIDCNMYGYVNADVRAAEKPKIEAGEDVNYSIMSKAVTFDFESAADMDTICTTQSVDKIRDALYKLIMLQEPWSGGTFVA